MLRVAGFVGAVLAVLVARAAPADADPVSAEQASAVAAAGTKLYVAGDYARAAARFDDAYALNPLPQYEFNAAQAYRLANDCAHAAERYATFLDVAQDAQNVEKVRQYLDDQRACAAKEHPAPPPLPPPLPAPVTPPPAPTPAPTIAPAQPSSPHDDDSAHGQHRTERIAGYALGGVGVALLAFGGFESYEMVHVKNAQTGCNNNPGTCSVNTFTDYNNDGRRANKWAPIGLGVGGAAVAGGVLLWLIGKDPERASIAVTGGGATVSTTFRF